VKSLILSRQINKHILGFFHKTTFVVEKTRRATLE